MSTDVISIEINDQCFSASISEETLNISIDGAMNNGLVSDKIGSYPSGDWKKVISIEYNPITGQLKINYE